MTKQLRIRDVLLLSLGISVGVLTTSFLPTLALSDTTPSFGSISAITPFRNSGRGRSSHRHKKKPSSSALSASNPNSKFIVEDSYGTDELSNSEYAVPANNRRLQVIQAGGIAKEGIGSSMGFILYGANIAGMLDADFLVTQTAQMFDYRVSDIVNRGIELRSGGRTCDILEILLSDPSNGSFKERQDRAMLLLDDLYERSRRIARKGKHSPEGIFTEYSLREIERCDTIIINDYRPVSTHHTPYTTRWWNNVISQYSGPPHGNDIAIHYRWGDVSNKGQGTPKWHTDMSKVIPLVDIIREENPTAQLRIFMKKSKNNETREQLEELLLPLVLREGDEIMECATDVEELSILSKAKYLFINSGSFSEQAAATKRASIVVENGGGVFWPLKRMGLEYFFDYNKVDLVEFRKVVKRTLKWAPEYH
ncbi:uncharacterized protein I303_103507 [Kwoniella dejecticola CBS 10117]|uniref:Uncharacterized protein n=1 Tax=Kwoniella dejecticola CBS 10117 TaxID=1296121 RepID=A0A1A6A6X8_9TREE|nr:uncharacterized protein I303_03530 [Kwoniella dejecticola CBS 10117]OBR85817.1 hypothetical protein I303_03530 [Kwoniella dejecticola CBS 10117]